MNSTDPEVTNLVTLAVIGIWTLIRFLGSRRESMGTRLLFTFTPHFAISLSLFMASCAGKTEANVPETCSTSEQFSAYADDLRRLANAKEMCGKLVNHEDFAICLNQPPIAPLERMDTCENVRRLDKALDGWLNDLIPAAKAACMQSDDCSIYLANVDHEYAVH